MRRYRGAIYRTCLSAGTIGLVLIGADRVPHLTSASVALILVLAIFYIAAVWGWLEALVAAMVAALGLDYFFLLPRGFGIAGSEQWLVMSAFLLTALATSRLAGRAKRHQIEAEQQRKEMRKLLQLSDALAGCRSQWDIAGRMAGPLLQVLQAESIAVYENAGGVTLRAGADGKQIAEKHLRDVAASGSASLDPKAGCFIVPIRTSGEPWGSIGIAGPMVSEELLRAAGDRLANAIADVRLADTAQEAEIVCRSDELKSAVFDALAHEARVPLGSIGLAVTALLSENPGDAVQQREMLCVIKEEMERIDRWIGETVRLGKTKNSQLRVSCAPRGVADVLEAARSALGSAVDRRLRVAIPKDLPTALCDGELTRRVLDLLLDNALKYSPPGSPIDVSAKLDADLDMVVITVSDRGPGVPEDERLRIFEKTYRGSQHKLYTAGQGLGLASAKHLIESQSGEIWVTSRRQGGAAFHFSLPAVRENAA